MLNAPVPGRIPSRRGSLLPEPWWSPEVVLPSAGFALASAFLTVLAVVMAAPGGVGSDASPPWNRGALEADAGLSLAALSMRFLARWPPARLLGLVAGAAVLAYGLLQSPPEGILEPRAALTLWNADVAAAAALGGVGITRSVRPSVELRASLYTTYAMGAALVGLAVSGDVLKTEPGKTVAAVVVLLGFSWRAAVLTRRRAW